MPFVFNFSSIGDCLFGAERGGGFGLVVGHVVHGRIDCDKVDETPSYRDILPHGLWWSCDCFYLITQQHSLGHASLRSRLGDKCEVALTCAIVLYDIFRIARSLANSRTTLPHRSHDRHLFPEDCLYENRVEPQFPPALLQIKAQ